MCKKMLRVLMTIFAIIVIVIIVLNVRNGGRREHELLVFDWDKFNYASALRFNWQMTFDGSTFNYRGVIMQRVFRGEVFSREAPPTDRYDLAIVLVHNESDASGFPDNVIAAWPSVQIMDYDLTFSEITVAGLNLAVGGNERELMDRHMTRPVVSFEDFGLSYPLQVSDLVDNWEKVFALWNFFDSSEQDNMLRGWSVRPAIPRNKRVFASPLGFGFNFFVVVNGEARIGPHVTDSRLVAPWRSEFDPFYDLLVFVHSEGEAHGFPDNVVVAWPAEGCPELHLRLDILNWEVKRDSISLTFAGNRPPIRPVLGVECLEREFGLSYPITAVDLVDNWEQVSDLMRHFRLSW